MSGTGERGNEADAIGRVPAADVADYALIGDLHTAAMVSRHGSIDWLCFPRLDSPACFAALLGTQENGHWLIAPAGPVIARSRRYLEDTLVLETEFTTDSGTVQVIDFMTPRDESSDLIRIVRCIRGQVDMQTVVRVRCDYGRVVPWVRRASSGIVAVAGPDALYFRSDVALLGQDHATGATFTVAAGDEVSFVLSRVQSHEPEPAALDPRAALSATTSYWRNWIASCAYHGRWSAQVRRSLITLKALTYQPTGGIVAAATTSLPERLGGSRNWDYRYCWLRDSTFTLEALISCGFTAEATAWRDWLLRAVAGDPPRLQVVYAVDGARRLPECELDWLPGFADSRPVRIGNAASGQFQLDIIGEVLDGLSLARSVGLPSGHGHSGAVAPSTGPQRDPAWGVQRVLCDFLAEVWQKPDDGLWEMRSERRHYVHSKVMTWVALDRMIEGAQRYGLPGPVQKWRDLCDQIHAEVCERGFDHDRGTFVQYYGSHELDASLLLLPRVGFLPWDDPRITATVRAIYAELTDSAGFVRRYRSDAPESRDGLAGAEGSFVGCSFWMVDALAGIGELTEAEALFARLLNVANDVGMLAEEFDGESGRQLGNTPQAYSHVGLINAARRLEGTGVDRDLG